MSLPSASVLEPAHDDDRNVCLVADGVAETYAEVRERASRFRAWIHARVPPRTDGRPARVAYVAHGDRHVHALWLALVGMGIVAVPIHPKLTAQEVSVLLRIAAPDAILDDADVARISGDSSLDGAALPALPAVPPETPLAIVFTSGTTGTPKGAVLSHRAFRASAEASAKVLGWQTDDRWLLCMPLAHVGGMGVLYRSLLARKAVVHFGRRPFDVERVLATMESTRTTIASLVPTMLARFVASEVRPPASLRVALLGGAAAAPSLLAKGRDLGWPLVVTYGLTEACSHVTLGRPDDDGDDAGSPLPGTDVAITDGQVLVRSATLFSGYLDQTSSPFDDEGYFRTGDLGELEGEGRLRIHSRRTDLVVTGGENVYPKEIENVVEAIPGVAAAAVFGVPDETWGQIVAIAIVVDPGGPSLADVWAEAKRSLAAHKVPRRGVIVDGLPVNALGKVLRKELSALADRLVPLG